VKKVAAPICVVLAIDSEDIGITQAPGTAEGSGGCFSTNAAVWKNKGHHSQLSLRMKSPLQCFTYKTCSSATACHIRLPSYRRGRDEDRLGRSSRGRASLTTSGRPPNSLPSKPFMAARPSESLLIVTNAKPRRLACFSIGDDFNLSDAPKLFEHMLEVSFSDGERNISNVEFHTVMRLYSIACWRAVLEYRVSNHH